MTNFICDLTYLDSVCHEVVMINIEEVPLFDSNDDIIDAIEEVVEWFERNYSNMVIPEIRDKHDRSEYLIRLRKVQNLLLTFYDTVLDTTSRITEENGLMILLRGHIEFIDELILSTTEIME